MATPFLCVLLTCSSMPDNSNKEGFCNLRGNGPIPRACAGLLQVRGEDDGYF